MSIVRVFYNPLDSQSKEEYQIEPGTRLIDFLQANFPSGFKGAIRTYVGIEELQADDLDYEVKEYDQVTILVMPADPATLGVLVLKALVAVAIGYVIGLIFKPKIPGGFNGPEESSVYSLSPTRNQARLGQPVTVHYGKVSFPPDFASAPYSYNYSGSNDQYVDELLCLGQGEFDIDEIFIGDTPVSIIEPGTVAWWVFGPDDHKQTMGVIEDAIWEFVKDGPAPVPFSENMFTSPEVDGWEFNDKASEAVVTPTAFSGNAHAQFAIPNPPYLQPGRIGKVDSALNIRYGDVIVLSNTASNNITFTVGSVTVDRDDPTKVSIWEEFGANIISDEAPLPGGTLYTQNATWTNMIAGPFRAQKAGQQLRSASVDITYPNGLYRVDGTSGNIKTLTVELIITFQEIDPVSGAPINTPTILNPIFESKLRTPIRLTYDSGELSAGEYEVTVERVTPIDDDNRKVDQVLWTALRGNIALTVGKVYGDTTLLAVRMKATNGLASAAQSRIRVNATRLLPSGDPSDNPIVAIKDIWTNTTYGLGRPESELDMAQLDSLETLYATVGPQFNASFDQKGTGFDGMQAVASLPGARVLQNGGLVTVIPEVKQSVRKALFTSANIIKDTLEITYTFDTQGDYDGVQVEYRDPETFSALYVQYPAVLPDGANLDTYTLFGCTDVEYAAKYARYISNVKGLRRKVAKFQTELEGLIPLFGDRIGISHPMPNWGQSGVIVDLIDPLTIRVDKKLDWDIDNVMMLRSDTGLPLGPYPVTKGATEDIVIFDTAYEMYDQQGREPTNWAFGHEDFLVRDFMVSKITPKGDTIVEIEADIHRCPRPDGRCSSL
jgi:hypothetical protein